jgi:glutathione reductase (NADPH)
MSWDCEWLVIGGGSGGIASARRAAQYGAKTILVEGGALGGTCVNVGCVPKKVMWHAAQLAEGLHDAGDYGFSGVNAEHDWGRLVERRRAYVERLNGIYRNNLEASGVELVRGYARFVDPHTVEVEGRRIRAEHILIATGSRADLPSIPGAEHGVDSDGFFAWQQRPQHVTVVGAGYIAVELAGVLRALGSQVCLLLRGERLLKNFERDISNGLEDAMRASGVEIRVGRQIESVQREGDELRLRLDDGEQAKADALIWATGRSPNTAQLGLAEAGLEPGRRGAIAVDEWQATAVPHIFAVGDVTGEYGLTPVAIKQGRLLADRLFGGQAQAQFGKPFIPTVVFSHPACGMLGMTEEQAVAEYGEGEVRCYRGQFRALYYGVLDNKVNSVVKMICAGPDDKVVGLHTLGMGSDEMLQGFAVAMQCGATKADFDATVAIHPTAAEEFVTLR